MKIFFVIGLFSSVAFCSRLPEGTKQCHRSDPNFDDCFKDAMTDGFKRLAKGHKPLGILTLDPIEITELSSENSGFKQVYKNVKITGIPGTKILKVKTNWDTLQMDIEALTPNSEMTADYTATGKLLTFPIDSSGKCKIIFENVKSTHQVKYERFQKNGKNYIKVVDWKLQNNPESVHYDFENLVPGNKQLSDTIIKTMNDNALDLFKELGGSFEAAYGEVHKAVANKVFEKVPEDELFLP